MSAPIPPIGPVVSPLERGLGGISIPTGDGSFGTLLTKALNDVGQVQQDRDEVIASFLRGEPVELHQVMAAAEEASLSLQMLVEIRNKLTEAYRSIMNLQV
ncbi:MAG: flagellar hook-basal body complex protein FliE [Gemmatimonadales bacterium]|nr:flagellar hook-basal body complex protein FliE [Gemmatimonadales bacterium]